MKSKFELKKIFQKLFWWMDEEGPYQTPFKMYDKPFDLIEMNESNFSIFFNCTFILQISNGKSFC